jgi:hypothetical protein
MYLLMKNWEPCSSRVGAIDGMTRVTGVMVVTLEADAVLERLIPLLVVEMGENDEAEAVLMGDVEAISSGPSPTPH